MFKTLIAMLILATASVALTSKVNAGPTKYHNAAPTQGGTDYKKNYECFTDEGYGRKLPCSYSTSGP
jgi:hypothetical protein